MFQDSSRSSGPSLLCTLMVYFDADLTCGVHMSGASLLSISHLRHITRDLSVGDERDLEGVRGREGKRGVADLICELHICRVHAKVQFSSRKFCQIF